MRKESQQLSLRNVSDEEVKEKGIERVKKVDERSVTEEWNEGRMC